jgi:hypothetical protein
MIKYFLVLTFFLVGCASQHTIFQKTKTTNTIESYKHFLLKYPEGVFADQAKKSIDRLNVIHSEDNDLRAKSFNSFINKEFYNEKSRIKHNFNNLRSLMNEMEVSFSRDIELLPLSIHENGLFPLLWNFEYLPTTSNDINYLSLGNTILPILNISKSIFLLYKNNKHTYEAAYLIHRIGLVACLIQSDKTMKEINQTTSSTALSSVFEQINDDISYARFSLLNDYASRYSGSPQKEYDQKMKEFEEKSKKLPEQAIKNYNSLTELQKETMAKLNLLKAAKENDEKTAKFISEQLIFWEKFDHFDLPILIDKK